MKIEHFTLLVKNYEEAINFYTNILGFSLLEDTLLDNNKRWVLLSPDKLGKPSILLVKVSDDTEFKILGNQTGNNVFLFLSTDELQSFYDHLLANEVFIVNSPLDEPWGIILKFKDLYGNVIEVIQPKE